MNLAFLAPEFFAAWGGVGIYSVELLRQLSKEKDITIHLITPDSSHFKNSRALEFSKDFFVHKVSKAQDSFVYNAFFQAGVARSFDRLHKEHHFDLVHAANLVHMPDIFLKFRKLSIPSLVTVHTTIEGQVHGFLQSNKNFFHMSQSEKLSILTYPYIKTLQKKYLKDTKHAITVSHRFAKTLRNDYSYRGDVAVIHNGIDVDYFSSLPKKQKNERFERLQTITDDIVLFAGRIVTQKGIEDFVKAASLVLSSKKDVTFLIAGRGNESYLLRLLSHYRLPADKVRYIGYVNHKDLPWLYDLASVFVLPSYYENLPISLLEAMASKCVCIATDVGAVSEIIDNGKNGIVVQPGDYPAIADHILQLLSDRDLHEDYASSGFEKVRTDFDVQTMALHHKHYYNEVLGT